MFQFLNSQRWPPLPLLINTFFNFGVSTDEEILTKLHSHEASIQFPLPTTKIAALDSDWLIYFFRVLRLK